MTELFFYFKEKSATKKGQLHFIKVHVPWEVMLFYAEELNFKGPLKVRTLIIPMCKNEQDYEKPDLKNVSSIFNQSALEGKLLFQLKSKQCSYHSHISQKFPTARFLNSSVLTALK